MEPVRTVLARQWVASLTHLWHMFWGYPDVKRKDVIDYLSSMLNLIISSYGVIDCSEHNQNENKQFQKHRICNSET